MGAKPAPRRQESRVLVLWESSNPRVRKPAGVSMLCQYSPRHDCHILMVTVPIYMDPAGKPSMFWLLTLATLTWSSKPESHPEPQSIL